MSYEIPAAEELTVRFEENFMGTAEGEVPGGGDMGDE